MPKNFQEGSPGHIAIIMDGNRRWAQKRGLKPAFGHLAGAKTLMKVVEAAAVLGTRVLTVYVFSTENWRREPEEVSSLFDLLRKYLVEMTPKMQEKGVCLQTIGNLTLFPDDLKELLYAAKEQTKSCNRITLVLALNYGGRDEIVRATKEISRLCKSNKLNPDEIDENLVSSMLDTVDFGSPDLLIRTSGETRISNFLLWQLSYTELYFTKKLWPDFSPRHLKKAIKHYLKRERRRGI